jgi:hypothetical protein
MSLVSKTVRSAFLAVTPQDQVITVLCAAPGTKSEAVLNYLHKQHGGNGYELKFCEWEENGPQKVAHGQIRVFKPDGEFIELPIQLSVSEDTSFSGKVLYLKDTFAWEYKFTYSLRETGFQVLPVGYRTTRIVNIAESVLATWVIRGNPWITVQRENWGSRASRKRSQGILS